ncbi:MAG: CDP-alcohol phosphatidyltransferase family protein [Sedimentisphaerales bacterium]|nr:CDP-alcohol phosphatidyltransferase family protein [Sedimentisphaerales bacterium]
MGRREGQGLWRREPPQALSRWEHASWLVSGGHCDYHHAMKLSWATRLTIMRILLVVPFISCLLMTNDPDLGQVARAYLRYAAMAMFVAMAVSDGLDGYLARSKRQVTRLGTFLDPVADKLLIDSACVLLASRHGQVPGFPVPGTVVVLIVAKDVLLTIGFAIVYLVSGRAFIEPVWIGKVATALQLVMVAAVLVAPELSGLIPGWIWVLRTLWWSAAGAAVLATLVYIRNGSRFLEAYEAPGTSN